MKQEKEQSYNSFDFLKEGGDCNFDNALKSLDSIYDGLFSDKVINDKDIHLEKLDTFNNDILAPIDKMSKQIFESKSKSNQPKYKKISENVNLKNIGQVQKHSEDQDQFIIGEPVFEKEQQPSYPKYPQEGYYGNKHS